jgi:hypothetical protein
LGSFVCGLEADDSIQGSSADDWIFGDEGNDQLRALMEMVNCLAEVERMFCRVVLRAIS